MTRKRRRFTADFKKRVALEALRERDTVQAIAGALRGAPEPGECMEAPGRGGPRRGVLAAGVEARRGARGDDPGPARQDRPN